MQRRKHHKVIRLSIFFLVYSIISVRSLKNSIGSTEHTKPEPEPADGKHPDTKAPEVVKTTNNNKTLTSPTPTTNAGSEVVKSHPTWRPKRPCAPPAIDQFPKPLISPESRRHGAIIIHIIVAIYTFFGLSIVCDDYFVAALDRICEELKLAPDVAGATFMAAGSSAPELATVIIGVFLAQDDIGVSGVIGSAVFNIMFVISVCALSTGTVCYLNWWPLVRDCFFYALSILIMYLVIYDKYISWDESLFMLIMYVVYCVALHYNPQMERWAYSLSLPFKLPTPGERSGLVNINTLDDEKKIPNYGSNPADDNNYDINIKTEEQVTGFNNFEGQGSNNPFAQSIEQQNEEKQQPTSPPIIPAQRPTNQQYYVPKDHSDYVNPLNRPEHPTWYAQIKWITIYPIHYMCQKTIPDCRTDKYRNWYNVTFIASMVWISFYSYFMVWMITIIGATFSIPDTVMGLTFIAAGVSVPDALSSIAVIKEGYGDMAVSNAVGSNVFDILVCLGLPWFIQTAIIKPGSKVNVISKGLAYSTISLFSTVIFLVVATHLNGWKLDRKYGIILMVWYLLFITFASLYEMNYLGGSEIIPCESSY